MTKLEELKADAARASDWASWATAWAARADVALDAYYAELKKTKEQTHAD